MKKRFVFGVLVLVLASFAWSTPWAIVVNNSTRSIVTIDLSQSPPKVYGPFLHGSLGGSGWGDFLLDVAVTPDGRYALISNFSAERVYRVDISDPKNPVAAGFVEFNGLFAEDVEVSPDGRFAVVSDGGFSNKLGFIRLNNFPSRNLYTIKKGYAQAVAVGGDSRTVVMADYSNYQVIYGVVNGTLSGLTSERRLSSDIGPVNVKVGPDGKTVVLCNFSQNDIVIYKITAPGVLVAGTPRKISTLPRGVQSVAFSPDGKKAYALSVSPSPDRLSWLNVNAPGSLSLGGAAVASLYTNVSSAYFGVDVLAVSTDGRYAVAGRPSSSGYPFNGVTVVDLTTFGSLAVPTNDWQSTGVACFEK